MPIRKKIFDAYALQHRSHSTDARLQVAVSDPNDGYFDKKLCRIHRQQDNEKVKAALSTFKPCGEYRDIKSVKLNTDDQIVYGLQAGKVMSAVGKLEPHLKSWLEWAYTIHGGENRALETMAKAFRLVGVLERQAKALMVDYGKTGEQVFQTSANAIENRISTINTMRGLGRAAGHDFFTWLDRALVAEIPAKTQARTIVIIKSVVLAAAVNYRYMAMRSNDQPFFSKSDICRMFGISCQSYTATYKPYTEWVYQQCDQLDAEALPVVRERIERGLKRERIV